MVLDEVGSERAAHHGPARRRRWRCSSPPLDRSAPARWSWSTPRPSRRPPTTTRSVCLARSLDAHLPVRPAVGHRSHGRRRWCRAGRATAVSPLVGQVPAAGASPGAMAAFRGLAELDAPPLLPLIQAPTLILHRRDSCSCPSQAVPGRPHRRREAGRAPGTDGPIVWRRPSSALDDRGVPHRAPPAAEPDRVLATVLFTDIVGSTEQAAPARRPALARAA